MGLRRKKSSTRLRAMLAPCRSWPPTSRRCSSRSPSSSASPPRPGRGSAPSNTSTPTSGSRATSRRRRAMPAWKWCCTTCRRAMRSAASAAPPACTGREQRFREDLERAIDYARPVRCTSLHLMAGVVPAGAERAALHATYVAESQVRGEAPGRGRHAASDRAAQRAHRGQLLPALERAGGAGTRRGGRRQRVPPVRPVSHADHGRQPRHDARAAAARASATSSSPTCRDATSPAPARSTSISCCARSTASATPAGSVANTIRWVTRSRV